MFLVFVSKIAQVSTRPAVCTSRLISGVPNPVQHPSCKWLPQGNTGCNKPVLVKVLQLPVCFKGI